MNFSIVSLSTGRFLKAMLIDLANFSLSKVDFLPFFLTTINSLSWTLSKVVNLCLQLHSLLLLITVPSSVGLESITEVSFSLQNGQIIKVKIYRNLEDLGQAEILSSTIGEYVMEGLKELDPVAYVRFASVYTNFKEAKDFEQFVDQLNVPSKK